MRESAKIWGCRIKMQQPPKTFKKEVPRCFSGTSVGDYFFFFFTSATAAKHITRTSARERIFFIRNSPYINESEVFDCRFSVKIQATTVLPMLLYKKDRFVKCFLQNI